MSAIEATESTVGSEASRKPLLVLFATSSIRDSGNPGFPDTRTASLRERVGFDLVIRWIVGNPLLSMV